MPQYKYNSWVGRTLHNLRPLSLALPLRGLLAGAVLPTLLIGCSPSATEPQLDDDLLTRDSDFVAVQRVDRKSMLDTQALGQSDLDQGGVGADFYLAIRKSALDKKYFMSAFIKQYYPGAVAGGAASSLGLRVVSFKLQNGRLVVFDADDRKKYSDYYDPKVLVDAYPLVTDYAAFQRLPGAADYILVDPAAGLNDFGVALVDAYAQGSAPEKLTVELSYLQKFRGVADGAVFEQVFSGFAQTPDPNAAARGEQNPYRVSGVLGLSLRAYQEGQGFKKTELINRKDPMQPLPEYYFRSEPKRIPNAGEDEQFAVHFNVKDTDKGNPNFKPIEFVVSDMVDKIQNQKRRVRKVDAMGMPTEWEEVQPYKDFDIYGAIAKGVTNWNDAFGFEALKVRKGTANDSPADDTINYIYVDEDTTFGAAFAQWRNNPNTGETRGASVYFSKLWLDFAAGSFEDDEMQLTRDDLKDKAALWKKRQAYLKDQRARQQRGRMLVWGPMAGQARSLCSLTIPPLRGGLRVRGVPTGVQLTAKEKVEQYVTHVVLHEVGHTLGLRHNFKGSLKWGPKDTDPKSSSVMEYVDDYDAYYANHPQSHDIAAIKYLHQLSEDLPKDPFCTDDAVQQDPNCTPYDQTDNPLEKYYGAPYSEAKKAWLEQDSIGGLFAILFGGYITSLSDYVRAGDTAMVRARAWELLIKDAEAPTTPAQKMINPAYAENADYIAFFVFADLFPAALDPEASRFPVYPTDPALLPAMVEQAKQNLLNLDEGRAFDTRRLMVDSLKLMQRDDAMKALSVAQDAIRAKLPMLSGVNKAETEDLLRRISKALSPYYSK